MGILIRRCDSKPFCHTVLRLQGGAQFENSLATARNAGVFDDFSFRRRRRAYLAGEPLRIGNEITISCAESDDALAGPSRGCKQARQSCRQGCYYERR